MVNYGGQEYPGIVDQIVGTDTEVDCMEKSGRHWKWPSGWPDKKDLVWYTEELVVKKISPPIPVSSRGQVKFIDF